MPKQLPVHFGVMHLSIFVSQHSGTKSGTNSSTGAQTFPGDTEENCDSFASGFNWFYSSLSADAEVLSEWRHISAILHQAQRVGMS